MKPHSARVHRPSAAVRPRFVCGSAPRPVARREACSADQGPSFHEFMEVEAPSLGFLQAAFRFCGSATFPAPCSLLPAPCSPLPAPRSPQQVLSALATRRVPKPPVPSHDAGQPGLTRCVASRAAWPCLRCCMGHEVVGLVVDECLHVGETRRSGFDRIESAGNRHGAQAACGFCVRVGFHEQHP